MSNKDNWRSKWKKLTEEETPIEKGGFVNLADAERYANTGWDIEAIEKFIEETLAAQQKEWIEKVKAIEAFAATIQKAKCGYSTADGDGMTCDCKFLEPQGDSFRYNIEATGCAEARAILWETKKLSSPK